MALDPHGGFAVLLSPVCSTSSDLGVGISSLKILTQRFSSIPLCIAVIVLFSGVLVSIQSCTANSPIYDKHLAAFYSSKII